MTTELAQAETVIRDALNELAQYEPDQIAEKLRAAGMLTCDHRRRTTSCPIYQYLKPRLVAHGLHQFAEYMAVAPGYVLMVDLYPEHDPAARKRTILPIPEPVTFFIDKFDAGDYDHIAEVTR